MKHKREISAGGVVYKKSGKSILWLITQHSQHKGWGFPKGIVGDTKADEAKEDAALREVQEEGGVKAKIVDPEPVEVTYKYRFKDYLVDKTVYYFLMEYESGDPSDHDWEVQEAKFVPTDGARTTLTYDTDKKAFEKILARLKQTV
jgi:8-oxo-dGTP pyrophosphatase MutT (NUDIX family)